MSRLKFFTDEHVSKAVVEQLRRRGINVLRCEEVGMKAVDDSRLLEYAIENGYVLLSMDDDVTRLHAEWVKAGSLTAASSTHQWHNSVGHKVSARLFCSVQNGPLLSGMMQVIWRKTSIIV